MELRLKPENMNLQAGEKQNESVLIQHIVMQLE